MTTSAIGSARNSATATAVLKSHGVPVPGKTITFTIGGETASAVTDQAGVASAPINISWYGTGAYPAAVRADFAGDALFAAAFGIGTLTATNSAPVPIPQSVATAEDTAIDIILGGGDPNGDLVTFAIASNPSHGSVSLVGNVAPGPRRRRTTTARTRSRIQSPTSIAPVPRRWWV